MHKKNPTNAQLTEANGIQQVKHEDKYVWLQPIREYQLH